jgi:hypothetical protein
MYPQALSSHKIAYILCSDIVFGLLRQSIVLATKQDAQEVISLSQLFDCGFSGVQKRFAEAIATDFVKRIREESALSIVHQRGWHNLCSKMGPRRLRRVGEKLSLSEAPISRAKRLGLSRLQ